MSKKQIFAILGGLLIGLVLAPAVVSGQEGPSAQPEKDRRATARAAAEQPAPEPRAFDSAASVYIPRATQCVLFDTRPTQGGSGAIAGGSTRTFALTGDLGAQGGDPGCSVPAGADGYHLNLVAIDPVGGGNFKAWPASAAEPNGGIVNYSSGSTMNNSNAFHITNDAGGVKVKANGATSHARGILYGTLDDGGNHYAPESLFAVVAGDGTLGASSGVVGVTKFGTGEYDVMFDRSVASCAHTATIGSLGAESAGLIDTANFVGGSTVTVFTQDPDGAPPPLADRGFHLVVTC